MSSPPQHRGIDPQTGHYFDDTKRYVDALELNDGDRQKVFELNARRVYPRLDQHFAGAGALNTAEFQTDEGWLAFHPDPSKPHVKMPPGSVDAHCHVFGPGEVRDGT